jgi:hypothetical protein
MVKKKMKLLIKMIDLLNHFSMKKLFFDQLQWFNWFHGMGSD